jgi:hypothetical protein
MYTTARLLASHSHSLANIFSTFTNSERKRRSNYVSEFGGKLPWDVRGMDETVPVIEVEMRRSSKGETGGGDARTDDLPELTRSDLDGKCLSSYETRISIKMLSVRRKPCQSAWKSSKALFLLLQRSASWIAKRPRLILPNRSKKQRRSCQNIRRN